MMQVQIGLVTPLEKREEIVRALRCRWERIRAERGNLGCRLYQEVNNENALCFIERWRDPADLLRHVQSVVFREILMLVDLSTEPPEFEFQEINATAGLEYLAALNDGKPSRVTVACAGNPELAG